MLAGQGKYVFNVFHRADARSVKKAVEALYRVHVTNVHMIVVASKKVRKGRHVGESSRLPHAIVTLKKGETIELTPQ